MNRYCEKKLESFPPVQRQYAKVGSRIEKAAVFFVTAKYYKVLTHFFFCFFISVSVNCDCEYAQQKNVTK